MRIRGNLCKQNSGAMLCAIPFCIRFGAIDKMQNWRGNIYLRLTKLNLVRSYLHFWQRKQLDGSIIPYILRTYVKLCLIIPLCLLLKCTVWFAYYLHIQRSAVTKFEQTANMWILHKAILKLHMAKLSRPTRHYLAKISPP